MANLPSSGEISLDDIIRNRTGGAGTNVSLKDESENFASGSTVAGSSIQTTARKNLDLAPYSLSEFYNADFNTDIITGITFSISGQPGGTTTVVDGDDFTANFTTDGSETGDYDVQLKRESNNFIAGQSTVNVTSGTSHSTTFNSLNIDEATYRIVVKRGFATLSDDTTFNHFELLSGGSTAISNGSQFVDAADESVTNVELTPTVSDGVQTSTSIGTTVITGGDGDDISATNTSGTTYSIQNTPGVLRFDVIHIGNPSSARNNTTSTATLDVRYNKAIDSLARDDDTINVSDVDGSNNLTISAVSQGHSGTLYVGYDDNNTASDKTFTESSEAVNTLYVRESVSKNFTINTAGTYFIKAYHNGDTNATVGGQVIVAPEFTYNTTGNQSIDVNQTQNFAASSIVGNGVVINVSSSPSIGSGATSGGQNVNMNPGTANGVYNISFNGQADYSQTNNQTDSLTVRPTVSISSNNNTPKGIGSSGNYGSGLTPTGVTEQNIVITAATVGDTISAYNWGSLPANFVKTGGGTSIDDFIGGRFSGGSSGDRTFTVTVSGNSTTSTQASTTVAYTTYSEQAITVVTPTSGTYRRGETSLAVGWNSRNIALVDIDLIGNSAGTSDTSFATDVDSITDTTGNAFESKTYSSTISDVGRSNVGSYNVRVRDASDFTPSETAISTINILDTSPTTPGAFNDSTGTYHGILSLDWNASSYAYLYQIFKSSGDSDSSYSQLGSNQSGTSVNISETNGTTTNGPFYYKIRAINFAQGPLSTEESSFNTPVRIIVMPTLDADNNQPSPVSSTIFSTENNSSNTSTTMQVSNKSDNTNLAFSYGLSSNTAGVNISNSNTENPTITAGTGVGSVNVTLTVTGDPGQSFSHSSDTITVNYFPKITSITNTSGTITQNTTNVNITQILWQGFDASSGFRVGVFDASSGGNEISSIGPIDVTGGTLTDNLSSGAGGTQNKDTEWLGNVNLGTISDSGTVYLRVTSLGADASVGQNTLTISSFNNVSITAGPHDTPEEALAGSGTPDNVFFLGTLGNGVTLFNGAGGTGGAFDGNNKFFKFSDGGTISVGKVNGSGVISEFNAEANVPPLAPTSLSFTSVTTTGMTLNWSDNSSIENEYYIFYKTGTSNDADFNDTAYSGNPLSANDITEPVTGLSSNQAYSWAVYAKNGTSYSNPLRGTQSTSAPIVTSFTIVPADFTLNATSGTATSADKAYTLSNGVGDTVFTFAKISGDTMINPKFAVATTANPSSFQNPGTDITLGSATNFFLRVRHDYDFFSIGNSAVFRVTATNNSVSDTLDITLIIGE